MALLKWPPIILGARLRGLSKQHRELLLKLSRALKWILLRLWAIFTNIPIITRRGNESDANEEAMQKVSQFQSKIP